MIGRSVRRVLSAFRAVEDAFAIGVGIGILVLLAHLLTGCAAAAAAKPILDTTCAGARMACRLVDSACSAYEDATSPLTEGTTAGGETP